MKKIKFKIFLITILSVGVLAFTFIMAGIIANANIKGFESDDSSFDYKDTSSKPISDNAENSSSESSAEEEPEISLDETPVNYNGVYSRENGTITITSSHDDFIEGKAQVGEITIEFTGQMVDKILVTTGVDSLNNTIEITLDFSEENSISAKSKPIIQYEETVDYLKLEGIYILETQ